MACEVPELKITVGPNPTLHQEQLTALLETQIYSHFMGLLYGTQWSLLPSSVISKRTLSAFLDIQKNLLFTGTIHMEYSYGKCEIHHTSSKNPSRSTLF